MIDFRKSPGRVRHNPAMTCACRVPNVDRLRRALGLRKAAFCQILGYHPRNYSHLVRRPHACPPSETIILLRLLLQRPDVVARLREVGMEHPWPEDLERPWWADVPLGALPRCPEDGLYLMAHPRCRQCRLLVGPKHSRRELVEGVCETCRAEDARGKAS